MNSHVHFMTKLSTMDMPLILNYAEKTVFESGRVICPMWMKKTDPTTGNDKETCG